MSAPVRSYRPEVRVSIGGNDVTRLLGDQSQISVRKSLYAPAGEFIVSFPDRAVSPTSPRDSLYGLTPIMAPVVIEMRRDAAWAPILRGFVRAASRDEQVGGDGRVKRQVVISGHDVGAAFIMQQIGALIAWQNQGQTIPGPLAWLRELALQSRPYKVADFIWRVATEGAGHIISAAGFSLAPRLSVTKGFVLPHQSLTQDGPIWELMKRYSDAPWNELFVREGAGSPELVFRPTPWRNIVDGWLPDVAEIPPFRAVPARDIVSLSAHRDDVELVNHVWVYSPMAPAAAMAQTLALARGTLNHETREAFGDRLQQLTTYLGPTEVSGLNNPEEIQLKVSADFARWIKERVDWAVLAGENAEKFERGRVVMKGRPEIQVGEYITVTRGNGAIAWDGYVVGVEHHFQPFVRYLTTVDYIRGNQWGRRLHVPSPWDVERGTESSGLLDLLGDVFR